MTTMFKILRLTARTTSALGFLGFIAAPLCGPNAAIVFIASMPFVALGAVLFCNPDI